MIIELPFDTPSKKNSRVTDTRTGRTFPNKKFVEWHRKAAIWLRSNFSLECFGDSAVKVRMAFTHGSNIRCDSDNKVSSVLDLLVDLHVIDDDRWQIVRKIEVENFYSKGNPSCRVEIERYEEIP